MTPVALASSSHPIKRRWRVFPGALLACLSCALIGPAVASAAVTAPQRFAVSTFAAAPSSATGPDDIAQLGSHVFVGWQNGVGATGGPSASGQTKSTIVEYTLTGAQVASWNVTGKADGLGADPANGRVIVTVNEDGNSSLYTISPSASAGSQVTHYTYSPQPDSASTGGLYTGGGTDAVTVQNGNIYVSASNPQVASATAAFLVTLNSDLLTATLAPTFADNGSATSGLTGQPVTLALTDPDSNATVPSSASRFGGDFLLDSQGDQQLVFASGLPGSASLTQLPLHYANGAPAGVDDVGFAAGDTLLIIDHGGNTVYKVVGPFTRGEAFASLDDLGTGAKGNNTHQVDYLNLANGQLKPFVTGLHTSKGLLFLSNVP